MSLPRRRFLGLAGAGAAGLVAADAAASVTDFAASPGAPQQGSLSDVEMLRNGYVPLPATWDMTWVDRVTGKHRAVFDSPDLSGGAAIYRAVMWRNQYKEVYGTDVVDTTAVVVVRHTAVVLAMNHEYWNRFEPGKAYKIKDESGKTVKSNPVAGPVTPPAEGAKPSVYNIPGFIASGGIVLACGVAFSGVVADFRKKDKLSREDADKVAREHLLPGVILQPSGVFAVMRAQEAGCQFMVAS